MIHLKMFTKEQEQQICSDYFSKKKPTTFLAKKWVCSISTIGEIIRRNGFVSRTISEANKGKKAWNKIFTKEEEKQICDEYFSEERPGIIELAKKYNCRYVTINNIIRRNGHVLRTHSEAAKDKKHSKETKQKMSRTRIKYCQNHQGPFKNTKPELKMKEILNDLNIPFDHQFRLGNCLFDFRIPNTNTLIEVDGDYWHSNPEKFKKLNKTQQRIKQRDLKKEIVVKENNFVLLRFWENDILNNEEKVKTELMSL